MARTYRKNPHDHDQHNYVDGWAYGSQREDQSWSVDWETASERALVDAYITKNGKRRVYKYNAHVGRRTRFIGKSNDQMFEYLLAKYKGEKSRGFSFYNRNLKFAINCCYRAVMKQRLIKALRDDVDVFVDDTDKNTYCDWYWD